MWYCGRDDCRGHAGEHPERMIKRVIAEVRAELAARHLARMVVAALGLS